MPFDQSVASTTYFLFCVGVLHSTSQSLVRPLHRMLDKATAMHHARAYVHHYAKHGLSETAFDAAFVQLEQVLASYRRMSSA